MRPAVQMRDDATKVGHYAGPASRLAAYVLDVAISSVVYAVAIAATVFLINLVLGTDISEDSLPGWVWLAALGIWLALYYGYCWAAAAKTPGMALVGVRIVRRDGSELSPGRGIARCAAYPLSFLTLGLGFVGIVIGREHRALHDVIADTTVVYDWDARGARLRFLVRSRDATTPPS
ncbi:MAG: RDD family protein [Acidimicrobiia bacterium]|nr:RDD family protein [Acidimicrobiia bacterium]